MNKFISLMSAAVLILALLAGTSMAEIVQPDSNENCGVSLSDLRIAPEAADNKNCSFDFRSYFNDILSRFFSGYKENKTANPVPSATPKPLPSGTNKPVPSETNKPVPTNTPKPVQSETPKPTPKPAPSETQKPTPTPAPGTPVVGIDNLAYEQKVVELVNIERAANGLSALSLNSELSKVARAKSRDMHDKNYFSHTSPSYGSPFDMMKSFGISYRTAGENIAMGYRTPESVVGGWMSSPGHRANILNSSFTQIGVGYVATGNYWTQMFIG